MIWVAIIVVFVLIAPFLVRSERVATHLPLGLSSEAKKILIKRSPFYQSLPSKSKAYFERRVAHFMRVKKFVPREYDLVTLEMKVCISAVAIQLLFGFPSVQLVHFKYILVYPDEYYSQITRKYHKGEVNPRHQAIVVSWKAFVEGFLENEGINLGLHELAHALHLENGIRNDEHHFIPKSTMDQWDQLSNATRRHLAAHGDSFFRPYAFEDQYEFFAVCVENFFERPVDFNQQYPELYQCLSRVLNQNPLLLTNELA